MKILVVGLGSMGTRRIRLLSKIVPKESIVGVDSQIKRVAAIKEEYSIECFDSIDKASEKYKFDLGFICTSPMGHYSISVKLIEDKVSVFCEINLINQNHANLIKLVAKNNVKYFLSSTPLYSSDRTAIKEIITKQTNVTYNYHIGQYLPDWHPWEKYKDFFVGEKETNGCREIMMIEFPWLFKTFGNVIDFSAVKSKNSTLNIDYPDTFLITLIHENGNKGVLVVDIVSRKAVRELSAFNEEIYIEWKGTTKSLYQYNFEKKRMEQIEIKEVTEYRPEYAEFINEVSYYNEIKSFLNYIENGINPEYDLNDDMQILSFVDKIEE